MCVLSVIYPDAEAIAVVILHILPFPVPVRHSSPWQYGALSLWWGFPFSSIPKPPKEDGKREYTEQKKDKDKHIPKAGRARSLLLPLPFLPSLLLRGGQIGRPPDLSLPKEGQGRGGFSVVLEEHSRWMVPADASRMPSRRSFSPSCSGEAGSCTWRRSGRGSVSPRCRTPGTRPGRPRSRRGQKKGANSTFRPTPRSFPRPGRMLPPFGGRYRRLLLT